MQKIDDSKCISCGASSNMNWFCKKHYEIKELAYKEARDKGLTNFIEVMILRDKRLKDSLCKSQ